MKALVISLFLIIIVAFRCDPIEKFYVITISNVSGNSVYFFETGLQEDIQYPDTILPVKKPNLALIKANDQFRVYSRDKWEDNFLMFRADTLSIYFLHTDTINKYSWDKIRNEYRVLKRYDLSLQDLKNLGFKIPYPPSIEMKGVKMYPK